MLCHSVRLAKIWPIALSLGLSFACKKTSDPEQSIGEAAQASPNAAIQPAPLENAQVALVDEDGIEQDAGNDEIPKPTLINTLILGHFEFPGSEDLGGGNRRTEMILSSDGSFQFTFLGDGYPFADQSKLVSFPNDPGNFLIWNDKDGGNEQRRFPLGSLRAWLGEGRLDVLPLAPAHTASAENTKFLGEDTVRITIHSPFGKLKIERATSPHLLSSGSRLCKTLLELGGINASNIHCPEGSLPLKVEVLPEHGVGIRWVADRVDAVTSATITAQYRVTKDSAILPKTTRELYFGKGKASEAGFSIRSRYPGDMLARRGAYWYARFSHGGKLRLDDWNGVKLIDSLGEGAWLAPANYYDSIVKSQPSEDNIGAEEDEILWPPLSAEYSNHPVPGP